MNKARWFIHPVMILIYSAVAVFTSLALYIYWYVEVSAGLRAMVEKAGVDYDLVFTPQTWVVIFTLSILVGIILVGISVIFIYNQKTLQFYRLQNNFINNFTHELRTPVTSLKLYLETFTKHSLPRSDQLKYLEYMLQDADRLSNNINRILKLAGIESGSIKGEFARVELVDFVSRFVEANRHVFKGLDIEIHNPGGQDYDYRIDVSLFEMMLMNLLTNAVKYNHSPQPGVEITFEPKGAKLHMIFQDNGIGLAPQETGKIFRKFYQVGQAVDMLTKGAGLGLYLVENIVRLHKGKVRASSPGLEQGSVFTVILPLRPVSAKT